MRYALILALATPLAAGTEHDPVEVLSLATRKAVATSRQIPNYSCVETVNREYFRPAANNLPRACEALMEVRRHPTLDMVLHRFATDRLRLDVSMTHRGEIFSWVGASKFDDAGIDHVVRNGPMGTGAFGGLLFLVFQSDVKRFTFVGDPVVDGRGLFEYSFQVQKPHSNYKVRVGNSWVLTGYTGTIRVDPETGELVGIRVETAELPRATGECMSTLDLKFEMVRLGDAEFLLPRVARQRFVSPTGSEVENTTEFGNCREYRGESTVIFEEAPPPAGNRARGALATPVSVPFGSRFTLALTLPISSDTAAAGDPFTGSLVQPLRDPGQKVLAPKGTVVEGHLLRVESFRMPPQVVVVLRPEALEIKGSRVPLAAIPDWQRAMMDARNRGRKRMEFDLPQPGEDHSGVFRFPGENIVIPRGFQSDWRTVPR
ncbi:MAG TPA: hypothetical protein VGZ73_25440 [Bryobacteraceae bacterium]|nr:hypothetical protein [Bryobacteraceae bacterium]